MVQLQVVRWELVACCRYGPKAVFVQASDEGHFNGKGFTGRQASRDRTSPPAHLIPVYAAGAKHVVQVIQAMHEVKEKDILSTLSMCVAAFLCVICHCFRILTFAFLQEDQQSQRHAEPRR